LFGHQAEKLGEKLGKSQSSLLLKIDKRKHVSVGTIQISTANFRMIDEVEEGRLTDSTFSYDGDRLWPRCPNPRKDLRHLSRAPKELGGIVYRDSVQIRILWHLD